MPDYQNGKIYKLINDEMDKINIGSTVQKLCRRLSSHKRDAKNGKPVRSAELFEYGTVKIILIKNFPCNSKEELEAEERKYIESMDCNNKVIPGRKRTCREYYQDNKERIKELSRKQSQTDKRKKWLEDNKERINEYRRERYKNNKKNLTK